MRRVAKQSAGKSRIESGRRAFTLIEIMVVIGILAIIMAISIPAFARQAHKDSMRQAVADFTEACNQARSRAILRGTTCEVRIRPGERTINAIEGSRAASTASAGFRFDGEQYVEQSSAGGGGIFTARISDHIFLDSIFVNQGFDLVGLDEVTCLFYSNGTSDELIVLIRSDKGEVRKITTDVVTGIADVEVLR